MNNFFADENVTIRVRTTTDPNNSRWVTMLFSFLKVPKIIHANYEFDG